MGKEFRVGGICFYGLFNGEFKASVACGGGGVFHYAQLYIAETHNAIVVKVFCTVDGKQVVELVEKHLGADVYGQLGAYICARVELEGATVVGCVDNHHASHVVARGHVGDVKLLALGAFVAYKGSERLDDVVGVASQLVGDIVGLGLAPGGCAGKDCRKDKNQFFHCVASLSIMVAMVSFIWAWYSLRKVPAGRLAIIRHTVRASCPKARAKPYMAEVSISRLVTGVLSQAKDANFSLRCSMLGASRMCRPWGP